MMLQSKVRKEEEKIRVKAKTGRTKGGEQERLHKGRKKEKKKSWKIVRKRIAEG